MHLKVFVKLKKTLKTLCLGKKTQKNPKKPKKTQKNPKKPKKPKKTQKKPKKPTGLGFFFKNPGFFQPWLQPMKKLILEPVTLLHLSNVRYTGNLRKLKIFVLKNSERQVKGIPK
jgi:hypothetical protein